MDLSRDLEDQLASTEPSEGHKQRHTRRGWFRHGPAVVPKGCEHTAAMLVKSWADGGHRTLLSGDMSRGTLNKWFAAFEAKVAKSVADKDRRSHFTRATAADPDRSARRWAHMKKHSFSDVLPARCDLESEHEHAALNAETTELQQAIAGWACKFILTHATTTNMVTFLLEALNREVKDEGDVALGTTKHYVALKKIIVGDHGPEPNHLVFASAAATAARIASKPPAGCASRLFASMRQCAAVLLVHVEGAENHQLSLLTAPQANDDGGGSPSPLSSSDDDEESEADVDAPPARRLRPRGRAAAVVAEDSDEDEEAVAPAERTFTLAEVKHLVKQSVKQAVNRLVIGNHIGCTINTRTRRALQQKAFNITADGDVNLSEPTNANTTQQEKDILDADVHKQCVHFVMRHQAHRRAADQGQGARPAWSHPPRGSGQQRGTHRGGQPRVSMVAATAARPGDGRSNGGAARRDGRRSDAIPPRPRWHGAAAEKNRPAHHARTDAPARTIVCWKHDRGPDGRLVEAGQRCGHATADCPGLRVCQLCKTKHTADYACTRQKRNRDHGRRNDRHHGNDGDRKRAGARGGPNAGH